MTNYFFQSAYEIVAYIWALDLNKVPTNPINKKSTTVIKFKMFVALCFKQNFKWRIFVE